MSTNPPTPGATLARLGPSRLVLVVALVAFHGLVRLAERYLPEFLSAVGRGPVVAGAVATVGLAVAVGVRRVEATDLRPVGVALVATALATVGLLTWAGASSLDALLGIPLTAIGWILIGAALIPLWDALGPGRTLGPDGDGFALAGPLSITPGPKPTRNGKCDAVDAGSVGDRRTRLVAGALGTAGAAVLATAAFAGGDTVHTGFSLLTAVGAAAGLVTIVTLAVVDRATTADDEVRGDREGPTADDGRTDVEPRPDGKSPTDGEAPSGTPSPSRSTDRATTDPETLLSIEDVRRAYASLPDDVRWPVLGDALVRLGTALASLFLVLLVADYHAVSLSIGAVSLSPVAVFGLLVLAEAVGAVAGAFVAPELERRDLDRRAVLAGGLLALSLVPLALVAAPPSAAVLAALFALFGARTALRPFRPTLGERTGGESTTGARTSGASTDDRLPRPVLFAIRVALVPAPLIGGLLYAISPVVAFGLATTIGLLGVRELLRAFV